MSTTRFLPAFLRCPQQLFRRWSGAHGSTDADDRDHAYRDAFGVVSPVPAHHGQRRMPDDGFATGPEVGERLPDFALRSASGQLIDFHVDRGRSRAAVVFFRSAVW